MTGWEFGKYLVDMAYSHWLTTIVFLCIICRVRLIELNSKKGETDDTM